MLGKRDLFLDVEGEEATHQALKDGVTLCKLINVLKPESIYRINKKSKPFFMMENISNFLTACVSYGVKSNDLFQTVDLYEKQNMYNVINGIWSLGRKAQTKRFYGPLLGPRESQENIREFTDEQIIKGRTTIGLQMGSHKGANQSGMNFGKSRFIID